MDSLLRCGALPEEAAGASPRPTEGGEVVAAATVLENTANFKQGTGDILPITVVQSAKQRPDKVFRVNIISDGDPSQMTLAHWERF